MENKSKNIATINIHDTEFEDENDGVIIVKSFDNIKIGLGVSQKDNGDAILWFNLKEARQVILALETAIKAIKE